MPTASDFQSVIGDAEYLAPLFEGMGFSESGDEMTGCSVVAVDFHRHPSAVQWGVVSVIVNTINREIICITICFRPFFERSTVVSPFIAYLNSSFPIAVVKC